MQPLKAVVIGGAGFIGSHICDALLARGYGVVCVDNFCSGTEPNIAHNMSCDRFRLLCADVRELDRVLPLARGCQTVYHLAAHKIPRYTDAYATLMGNLTTLQASLEIALKNKARFILASTSDVYGKNPQTQFSEDANLVLGPSTSRRWAYAASKLFGEHLSFSYADRHGLEVVILRYFGSYGHRNRLDWWGGPQGVFIDAVASRWPLPIHGDGLQTRSFTYVTDTAEASARAAECKAAVGEIINVGSNHEISILDLAHLIRSLWDHAEPFHIEWVSYQSLGKNYEDVRRRVPDIRKCQRLLGFTPAVDLVSGLRRTIEWYASLSSEERRLYGGMSNQVESHVGGGVISP